MQVSGDIPEPFIRKGGPILAKDLNALARIARRQTLLPGMFSSGAGLFQVPTKGGVSTGGSSSTPTVIRIVLIDADIIGIKEAEPSEFIEYELTEEEIADGYTVAYQDPPDDDYAMNLVAELNKWKYKRQKVTVKYFTSESPIEGEAQSGGSTTIELAAGSSTVDDFYVGDSIEIEVPSEAAQTRVVTAYDGTTLIATVESAWDNNPSSGTPYTITFDRTSRLATTAIDDADSGSAPRKIVQYATIEVYYDDGKDFLLGEYERSDYPDYPENEVFPPDGSGTYDTVPAEFLKKRYRAIVINNVLITALCEELPAPALTEL